MCVCVCGWVCVCVCFVTDVDRGVWIGGNDLDIPGVYIWSQTRHEITVPGFGWSAGEPDMDKHCVKYAAPTRSQHLVTDHCSSNMYCICE